MNKKTKNGYFNIYLFSCICASTLVVFASALVTDVLAIDNTPQWATTQFQFSQPGARSKGIGRAFVGAADDATAALVNPAGLAQLPKLQLYIEGRLTSIETERKPWKALDQDATLTSQTIPVGQPGEETEIRFEDKTDLSFAAISAPLTYKDITLNTALFYNKLANVDAKMASSVTVFPGPVGVAYPVPAFPAENEIEIDEYGLSVATGFFENKLMVGAGISIVHLDLEAGYGTNYVDQSGFDWNNVPFDGASRAEDNESIEMDGSDTDVAWRFGAMYRVNDKLSFGASAQLMPNLDYDVVYSNIMTGNPLWTGEDRVPSVIASFTETAGLPVPDSYSLGMAYRIRPEWTVFVEGKYIEYSDMEDGFSSTWGNGYADFTEGRYSIDDIWETHVGTEYVLTIRNMPLALRLGAFFEPAHGLEFEADTVNLNPDFDTNGKNAPGLGLLMEELLDGGEDVMHYSFGAGTVIMQRLQVDVAGDITDDGDMKTFSMSMAYEF